VITPASLLIACFVGGVFVAGMLAGYLVSEYRRARFLRQMHEALRRQDQEGR
jgi:fructose-specific phosphotransferase system IIC component